GQITNERWAVTDVIANSSDHLRSMTQETKIPVMLFGGRPFLDDSSCSPTPFKCSTSDDTRLHTMPQEANQVLRTYNEGKHLVPLDQVASAPVPDSKLCAPPDRGARVEKMIKKKPYQCGYCCIGFAQRQGLTRHKKDKHKNKIWCEFCAEFAWPQGRRYVYHKHLQKKHPGVVSPSVSATPIALK
ncbi:hypothetical protein BJY52DRAFT_1285172, partial [Lactarius psammicola]